MSAFLEYLKTDEKVRGSEEQLAAIMSERNTVVSAGAGSGKTTVLSYRFLRLVMDGLAEPEEILTLTFTRKAALEMLTRIREKLASSPVSDKRDKVTSDTICTLDSFCTEIAKAGSVKYGVSRSFKISEDQEEEKRLERLMEAFLRDEDNAEEVKALSAIFNSEKLKDGFFSPLATGTVITETYASASLYDEIEAEFEAMQETIATLSDRIEVNDDRDVTTQKDVELLLDRIATGEEVGANEVNKLKNRKALKYREDLKSEIDKYYIFSKALKHPKKEWEQLQSAVSKFIRLLNEDKRRSGALTHADVSSMAVDVLKTNEGVRSYYKKRFKYIMIDEFQDNNEQQRNLLFLLAEKEDCYATNSVPDISALSEDKLFFVGDEKQSIYRFRGADVSVFRKLQDEIVSAGGCALQLSSNYRSDGSLVDYFNNSYKSVFENSESLFEARYEMTKAARAREGGSVRLALLDKGILETGQDPNEIEADYIGSLVNRMLYTDEFLIKDSKRKCRRRPEAGDIAILVQKGSGIQQQIERSLKNRGVEYQLTETRSLMTEALSSDFYNLLQLMVYPKDRLAETAVLRSPFVRLSDLGLYRWANDEAQEGEDKRKYESWLVFKARVEEAAFRLPLPSLLEFIWIEGGYASYILENALYADFEEHYEYLYSYAVSFLKSGRGLVEFVSFLRNSLGNTDKLPETTVLHLEKKGVQIMTIHKSKGLEFPIVIVAGTGGGSRGEVSQYLFKKGGSFYLAPAKEVSKLYFDDTKLEEAELKRLLYVSETRAEDHLVLTGSCKYNKDGSLDGRTGELLKQIMDKIGYSGEAKTAMDKNIVIENITNEVAKFSTSGGGSLKAVLESKYKAYVAPSFKSEPHRLSVTSLEALSEEEGELLPSLSADAIIAKYSAWTDFGTLTHLVLEKAVKGESLSDIGCNIAESEAENKALLKEAFALKDAFFESRLWAFVGEAERECELRFYVYYPPLEAAAEGVADLVVFLDDYILVIDYKTDASRRENAHKVQLTTYVKAIEEIYGRRCLGTICYLRDLTPEPFIDKDGNTFKVL